MIKIAALIVTILIAAVLIFATTKPDSFQIQRSLHIKAPPANIFALINDFHRWKAWSPWANEDPAMKSTHSGAARGMGAVYAWAGNRNVGEGRMEIIDMSPPSRIKIRLDLVKPIATKNIVEFALTSAANFTEVTWTMHGPMPFISKLVSVFVTMDTLVGNGFETGLESLKALAEK